MGAGPWDETLTRVSVREVVRARPVLTACVGYAVLRAVSALIVVWVGQHAYEHTDRGYLGVATQWDGGWYGRIADHGYPAHLPHRPDGSVAENEYAFLPLYPGLVRALMWLTHASYPVLATTLSLILGLAATAVVVALLRRYVDGERAVAATLLLTASPAAFALQMAYSESLGLLILAGVLLALVREQWWWVTGLALVLGLARPLGPPLVVAVLVAVWLRFRDRDARPMGPAQWAGPVTAVVATAAGGWLWSTIVWWRTGVRDGYLLTELAWQFTDHARPFGSVTGQLERVLPTLLAVPAVALVVAGLIVLVRGPWARPLGWVLRSWTLAYLLYVVALARIELNVPRLLLPAFPLLVLCCAGGLRRTRVVLVAVALVAVQVGWAWLTLRGPGYGGAP